MDDKSKPDPYRVFQAIADIIGDRYNVKITVTEVRKKTKKTA